MTTKWPSSCFGAVSRVHKLQSLQIANANINANACITLRILIPSSSAPRHVRSYATQPPSEQQTTSDLDRHEKAALVEIQGLRESHRLNAPRSTLPAPLNLPEKGQGSAGPTYYFKLGRAYGSFYWRGIKAVWFNSQASKLLRERISSADAGSTKYASTGSGAGTGKRKAELMSRSEFQLLERNAHDIGKLPFFGLLVALFGEWLPLLVPFIPGAVPGTCRIPKQVEGMRKKREERRRAAFRMGIEEPGSEIGRPEEVWALLERQNVHDFVIRLKDAQLFHLSSTLNLHNRLWDRVQLPPPAVLMRRAITRRLGYLTMDDYLLLRCGGGAAGAARDLSSRELFTACEERGIDVLGKQEVTLRSELQRWLARQSEDEGRGRAILTMLFRRPNAWDTKKIAAT